ncbi:MAG: amidohydrolase family protein [Muribaculaceae bacterium]|nr:amidohydrolase family protein [Muribaculaceae bacterium]
MRTLIRNVRFAGDSQPDRWVVIDGQFIDSVGQGPCPAEGISEIVDGDGCLLMPGVIDCHVHFREPGMTQKADIASESRAALAGGVTSYLDMPNTMPATTSAELLQEKADIAARTSAANYGFLIGATAGNIDTLASIDYCRQAAGIKLFVGSSTGSLLVDEPCMIERVIATAPAIVAVHAEDQAIVAANIAAARERYQGHPVPLIEHSRIRSAEACAAATARVAGLADRYQKRVHICHISTAHELDLLGSPYVSSEVSPHHLLWCEDDYAERGTRIKMNPSVKTAADREALRQALRDGIIDMVATDHAPHLLSDKEGDALTATSGAPLVQFSLPVMLNMFDEPLVQRVMCEAPARIYRIERRGRIAPGHYAHHALVQEPAPFHICL